MSKAKILVIDDAPTVSRFMEMKLGEAGFTVISAPNAKTGVGKAQKELPDLIITDFVLPDATGGQICAFLRRHKKYSDIPIILVSGDRENFENKKLSRLPNVHFLVKPFTGPELIQKVEKLLEQPKKITTKEKPEINIEKMKELVFHSLEDHSDEFIKAKYSFQVKKIIAKAISEAFEKL